MGSQIRGESESRVTFAEALMVEGVRSGENASSSKGKQPAAPMTPSIVPTEDGTRHPASPAEQRAASPSSSRSSGASPPCTPHTATGATAAAGAQALSRHALAASQHLETPPPSPAVVQPDAMRDPEPMWCCVICQEVLLDPVTLPCGHHFDRNCVHCLLNPGEALLPWEPCTLVCSA
jgi:hypothetical protein